MNRSERNEAGAGTGVEGVSVRDSEMPPTSCADFVSRRGAARKEGGCLQKRSRVLPEDMTPDSILRELGYLSGVIRRSLRPAEGMGRTLQILIRLSLHEDAMSEGLAPHLMSQAELASSIGIRPQSVGPVLVDMEAQGLITRTPSASDRRTTRVALTDAGRESAADARRTQREFAEQTLSVLTDEERASLAAAVLKLNAAVRERGDRF